MHNEKQNTPKNIAIILAGGSGSRMGGDLPKQFLPLAGKTVLEHSVEAFEQNSHIDEIAIVCAPVWNEKIREMATKNGWSKLKKILPGGKERYHSSLSAIEAYQNTQANVFPQPSAEAELVRIMPRREKGRLKTNLIFHDAARPLLNQRIINDVVEALQHHQAVDVAQPCTDTILEVKEGFIKSVPDRSHLMRSQTPQAFAVEVIAKAYEIALKDKNFSTTDDCGVVLKYLPNIPIFIVPGDERNIKLTYPQDLALLEILVKHSSSGNISDSLRQPF